MNNFYIILNELKKLNINKKKNNVIFKYDNRLMVLLENNLFIEIDIIYNDTYLFEDKKYYDFNKLISKNMLKKIDYSLPSRKLIMNDFLNQDNYELLRAIDFTKEKTYFCKPFNNQFIEDIDFRNNDCVKVYKNDKQKLIMLNYNYIKIYKTNLVY